MRRRPSAFWASKNHPSDPPSVTRIRPLVLLRYVITDPSLGGERSLTARRAFRAHRSSRVSQLLFRDKPSVRAQSAAMTAGEYLIWTPRDLPTTRVPINQLAATRRNVNERGLDGRRQLRKGQDRESGGHISLRYHTQHSKTRRFDETSVARASLKDNDLAKIPSCRRSRCSAHVVRLGSQRRGSAAGAS